MAVANVTLYAGPLVLVGLAMVGIGLWPKGRSRTRYDLALAALGVAMAGCGCVLAWGGA